VHDQSLFRCRLRRLGFTAAASVPFQQLTRVAINRQGQTGPVIPPNRPEVPEVAFPQRNFYVKKSRFTDSQIMAALKRVEAGLPVPEVCRELGISSAPFTSGAPSSVAWTPP